MLDGDRDAHPHRACAQLGIGKARVLDHGSGEALHADLVGARNIAMRTSCVWQDWAQTGQLSVAPGSLDGPDLSGGETKAARLARLAWYADLRWSLGRNLS